MTAAPANNRTSEGAARPEKTRRGAVTVANRAQRVEESKQKICPPFALDPSLCLYSPQDNVAALTHPRIADWIAFIAERYLPHLPQAERRILLLMPCTKTKPYPASTEHQAINMRLFAAGFKPVARQPLPAALHARLGEGVSPDVLDLSVLSDGKGTAIHRMVISEPMALVPYEHIVAFEDKPSPATAYDDPGLFEKRGNAVSPWRKDFTATQVSPTRWAWGDEERRHYVLMHNAMADVMARTLARIGGAYTDIVSWVAPGLTHRSFVVAQYARAANNVPAFRRSGTERLALVGANDLLPDALAIECLPTIAHCRDAMMRLARRLDVDPARVGGVYSRGGANATPLALPELLDVLIARLAGRDTSVSSRQAAGVMEALS